MGYTGLGFKASRFHHRLLTDAASCSMASRLTKWGKAGSPRRGS